MYLSSKDILMLADPATIKGFMTGELKPSIVHAKPILSITGELHQVHNDSVTVLAGLGGDNWSFINLPIQPEQINADLQRFKGCRVTITLSIDEE